MTEEGITLYPKKTRGRKQDLEDMVSHTVVRKSQLSVCTESYVKPGIILIMKASQKSEAWGS